MMQHYRLDDNGEPVPCVDWREWAEHFENQERRVDEATVEKKAKYLGYSMWVSTVFLGLNHRFSYGEGPPILWETMIFVEGEEEHPLDDYQTRCAGSREQAIAMHQHNVTIAQEWCVLDTFPRRLLRFLWRKTGCKRASHELYWKAFWLKIRITKILREKLAILLRETDSVSSVLTSAL